MLELHRLRLLVELHRRGTIAEVARVLSFSASAVSQQLSVLEREAGVELLVKVGRRVRLTPDAQILVSHAEAVLDRLEYAEAELAAAAGQVRGTFRVGCFTSVTLALIPTVLSRLAEQHPMLTVEVSDSAQRDTASALAADDFDIVVYERYPHVQGGPGAGVHSEPLLDDELLIAVPPATKLRGHVLSALREAAWVLETDRAPAGQWIRLVLHDAGVDPQVRFTSSDLLMQIELVRRGLAVSVIPGLHVGAGIDDVSIVHLPGRPHRRIFTAVRSGAASHPRVLAFRAALRESAATMQSSGGVMSVHT